MTRAGAVTAALAAAALFGAAAPVLKPLTAVASPLILTALLYLGAGTVALIVPARGPSLQRGDGKWMIGVVLCGGLLGPLLLLVGLQRTSATASSLLLNLETVFTTLFALALFGERLGRRAWMALALLIAGAVLITFERGGATRSWIGPLAVAGACASWGLDNNLTQKLSARDPLVVVRWKGLCAGAVALIAAFAVGARLPSGRMIATALLTGGLAYGVSLALYVRALRELGAARTGMLFATAPFAGAVLAIVVFGERPIPGLAIAAAAMALGVILLATERR